SVGVDRSVAAALLLREGYDVVGCCMRLGSPGETFDELMDPAADEQDGCAEAGSAGACNPRKLRIGHQGCCSINDAADARLVAAQLGIPFYVVNFKKDFGRIIDYFVSEYNAGRTPNPCVRCNDWLKFGKLHAYAQQIDAQFVASGHYARMQRVEDSSSNQPRNGVALRNGADASASYRLLRGVDHTKDQSYVLFGAPRERLAEMLLPIGDLQKSRVRELAREFGLPVFNKPDSQEICFVPDNDYASLVEKRRPGERREGAIVDPEGRVVGTHDGQHRFTIGQRRGVGVALGYPIYVVNKDPRTNTVTVGPGEMLDASSCAAREVNWLGDASRFVDWRACLVKIRYNAQPVEARCRVDVRNDRLEIEFASGQRAVAPGQAAVCYDAVAPEVVLGGGWIGEVASA